MKDRSFPFRSLCVTQSEAENPEQCVQVQRRVKHPNFRSITGRRRNPFESARQSGFFATL